MATSPTPSASRAASRTSSGPDTLVELLSSRVRAAVLGLFVARPGERFSLTELSRALDLSISSIQHECYKLERLQVLKGRREGVSRRYWLDHDTSFVPPLVELVTAVLGREQLLGHALREIEGVRGALLVTGDDPRLVLVGELGLEELETVQQRAGDLLGIDPDRLDLAFYDTESWREHCAGTSSLTSDLSDRDPIVLVGDADELLPS